MLEMPRRMDAGNKNYRRLKDDGFTDIQFHKPPPKFPRKAIVLAVTLCVIGVILLLIGSLLLTGVIDAKGVILLLIGSLLLTGVIDAKYGDRTWPVIILGALMFIPGFYHVRIAYYAYMEYDGYSYDDIPEFE